MCQERGGARREAVVRRKELLGGPRPAFGRVGETTRAGGAVNATTVGNTLHTGSGIAGAVRAAVVGPPPIRIVFPWQPHPSAQEIASPSVTGTCRGTAHSWSRVRAFGVLQQQRIAVPQETPQTRPSQNQRVRADSGDAAETSRKATKSRSTRRSGIKLLLFHTFFKVKVMVPVPIRICNHDRSGSGCQLLVETFFHSQENNFPGEVIHCKNCWSWADNTSVYLL